MSLAFDGVDDLVTNATVLPGPKTMSIYALVNPITAGESNFGIILAQGFSTARYRFGMGSAAGAIEFYMDWTTTDGRWRTTSGIPFNKWSAVAATYDGNANSNDAKLYIDGVVQPITQVSGPSGTISQDPQVVHIGARSDKSWSFKGQIAELATWGRVLSPAEIGLLQLYGIHTFPDFSWYSPMDSGSVQEFWGRTPLTVTGPLVGAENPPCRPAGRRG